MCVNAKTIPFPFQNGEKTMSETTNNAEQAIQAQLRRLEWMIPDAQRRLAGVAQEMLRRAQNAVHDTEANGDKNMNLDTLIEILNDYREEHGGDAEVRMMTQQNWPFENRICGVTSGQEMNDTNDDEADDDQDVADENIVYIVEGGQICYGSKRAWETCRNS
jgi:hypothetical protein